MNPQWCSLESIGLPNYEISSDARIRNKRTNYIYLNVFNHNKIIVYIRNDPNNKTPILLDIKATYIKIFEKSPNFKIKCKNHNIENQYRKSVDQLSLDGTYIRTFRSAYEAQKKLHIDHSCISTVCHKRRRHAGGYKWRFTIKD
jgi:hypothetical protein